MNIKVIQYSNLQKVQVTFNCHCDIFTIDPQRNWFGDLFTIVCQSCKGIVSFEKQREYERYIGASGWNEYNDDGSEYED